MAQGAKLPRVYRLGPGSGRSVKSSMLSEKYRASRVTPLRCHTRSCCGRRQTSSPRMEKAATMRG